MFSFPLLFFELPGFVLFLVVSVDCVWFIGGFDMNFRLPIVSFFFTGCLNRGWCCHQSVLGFEYVLLIVS